MDKRGISPLIATVLIVGFTIILAVIVVNFVLNTTQNQIENQEEQLDTLDPEVNFDVTAIKNSGGVNRVLITNNGPRDAYFILTFDSGETVTTTDIPAYVSNLYYSTLSASKVTVTPVVDVNGLGLCVSILASRYFF